MTGSLGVTGSVSVSGSITATGTLTAQTLVVQTVTSSIVYSSGSNIFGNQLTDVQQMTGSLRVTGSGNHYIQGGLVGIGTVNSFLAQLNAGRISAGATTRALSLYNNSSNVSSTGVSIEFYPNTGNDDRCARISSVNTTSVNSADLRFFTSDDTAPVQRMTITKEGNVGIGTTSPSTTFSGLDISSGALSLIIGADNGVSTRTNATQKVARFGSYNYTNANAPVGMMLANNDGTNNLLLLGGGSSAFIATTQIQFYTAANNNTASGTERMSITSGGYLRLAGAGIQFNGDTADANSLDDYEEGTFTPTITFSTSGSPSYILRLGTYTKIGRQVTVNLMVNFSDNTGAGNVTVTSLPFTSNSTTNYRLAGSISGAGMTGIVGGLAVFMGASSTTLDILQTNGGAYVGSFVTNANTTTDTDFSIGITYFTS